MSLNIEQKFLTPNKYSRPRTKLNKLKGVVIHWYANPNTSALANRNFFENRKLGKTNFGSAHYLIGQKGEIIQALPEAELAYHVGAKKYKQRALQKLSSHPNNCTIGIELAHIDWNGKMNSETYNAAIELVSDILKRHGLDEGDLWLHFEITGKDCHKWFVDNPNEWSKFKSLVGMKLKGQTISSPIQKVDSVTSSHPSNPLLKKGMKGEAVARLQTKLNEHGAKLVVDGDFGNSTYLSVVEFQKKNSLNVDGLVGNKTWECLYKQVETKPEPVKVEQPVTDDKKYRLMTGAFPNAEEFAKALEMLEKEYGWKLYEKSDSLDLNPTYRIVTGTFVGKQTTEKMAAELRRKYNWTVYVQEA